MHTFYSLFFHYFQDTALVVMIWETGSDQEFSCGGRAAINGYACKMLQLRIVFSF